MGGGIFARGSVTVRGGLITGNSTDGLGAWGGGINFKSYPSRRAIVFDGLNLFSTLYRLNDSVGQVFIRVVFDTVACTTAVSTGLTGAVSRASLRPFLSPGTMERACGTLAAINSSPAAQRNMRRTRSICLLMYTRERPASISSWRMALSFFGPKSQAGREPASHLTYLQTSAVSSYSRPPDPSGWR